MTIIRGENITEVAQLTATKELLYLESKEGEGSFIEEECRKAFQQGVEQGKKIGYEKYAQENKPLLELLPLIAQKLLEQKRKLLELLKPEIVEFCLHVCERVLRRELSQPESMATLINSLLNVCLPQFSHEKIHILLAPEDLVMLENHLTQIHFNKREIEGISFRADPLIKRGDCRIEAKTGLLNYSIARELADLQAKVLQ
jgi:flagellar biosynthesis/type III secretory pathway protein FliH